MYPWRVRTCCHRQFAQVSEFESADFAPAPSSGPFEGTRQLGGWLLCDTGVHAGLYVHGLVLVGAAWSQKVASLVELVRTRAPSAKFMCARFRRICSVIVCSVRN